MTTKPKAVYISDQESIAYPDEGNGIAESVEIGVKKYPVTHLPGSVVLRPEVGLVMNKHVHGQLVHVGGPPRHMVFETRAVVTPRGDYLLMFPDGLHYGWYRTKEQLAAGKWNDMIAYRSSDKGKTWQGPSKPFDVDFNHHGFVPLIPRGTSRIYCFGTQPIWGLFSIEKGTYENAPIGYRYSDDDGFTWSEVRLIRPRNDPDFLGMSVTRMCETDAGTWIIGRPRHALELQTRPEPAIHAPVGGSGQDLGFAPRPAQWRLVSGAGKDG